MSILDKVGRRYLSVDEYRLEHAITEDPQLKEIALKIIEIANGDPTENRCTVIDLLGVITASTLENCNIKSSKTEYSFTFVNTMYQQAAIKIFEMVARRMGCPVISEVSLNSSGCSSSLTPYFIKRSNSQLTHSYEYIQF